METLPIETIPRLQRNERRICAVNIVSKSKDILYFDWDFPTSEFRVKMMILNEWMKTQAKVDLGFRVMDTEDGLHLYKVTMPNVIQEELDSLKNLTHTDYPRELDQQILRFSPKWDYNLGIILSPAPALYCDTGCNPFVFPHSLEIYEKVDKFNPNTKSFPPLDEEI